MSVFLPLLWALASLAVLARGVPPVCLESFELEARGRVWDAERESLGSARMSTRLAGGEREVELRFELEPIATHVQRVLRQRGDQATFVWREWRSAESDPTAQSGRTLVLESGLEGAQLREWAGRAMRIEALGPSETTLSLVDRARGERGLSIRCARRFDPLEATIGPALVIQAPLSRRPLGGLRMVTVLDLDGRAQPSRWVFQGQQLLAFAEGNLCGQRRDQEAQPQDELQLVVGVGEDL